jgi:hypothetical protein
MGDDHRLSLPGDLVNGRPDQRARVFLPELRLRRLREGAADRQQRAERRRAEHRLRRAELVDEPLQQRLVLLGGRDARRVDASQLRGAQDDLLVDEAVPETRGDGLADRLAAGGRRTRDADYSAWHGRSVEAAAEPAIRLRAPDDAVPALQ